GLRFAYFEEGAGPLVLLLHGFPDTPHSWDAVRPAIAAAGFRAVGPFMRGHAPTELPREEGVGAATAEPHAPALIGALRAASACGVGHGGGGVAAYSAAAVGRERVRQIVTLSVPHPGAMKPTPSLAWSVRHFFFLGLPGAAARIRAGDFQYIDELWQRWSPG